MASLAAGAGPLFGALFALLGRLEEAESKVRVLQLVSVAVEVLGDAAQPHLGAVASALPQVRAHAAWLLPHHVTSLPTGCHDTHIPACLGVPLLLPEILGMLRRHVFLFLSVPCRKEKCSTWYSQITQL